MSENMEEVMIVCEVCDGSGEGYDYIGPGGSEMTAACTECQGSGAKTATLAEGELSRLTRRSLVEEAQIAYAEACEAAQEWNETRDWTDAGSPARHDLKERRAAALAALRTAKEQATTGEEG